MIGKLFRQELTGIGSPTQALPVLAWLAQTLNDGNFREHGKFGAGVNTPTGQCFQEFAGNVECRQRERSETVRFFSWWD